MSYVQVDQATRKEWVCGAASSVLDKIPPNVVPVGEKRASMLFNTLFLWGFLSPSAEHNNPKQHTGQKATSRVLTPNCSATEINPKQKIKKGKPQAYLHLLSGNNIITFQVSSLTHWTHCRILLSCSSNRVLRNELSLLEKMCNALRELGCSCQAPIQTSLVFWTP